MKWEVLLETRYKSANVYKVCLNDAMQIESKAKMKLQSAATLNIDESVTIPNIKLCEIYYCKIEAKLTCNMNLS